MTHTDTQYRLWRSRPFSNSQYTKWLWNKEEWYESYLLGIFQPGNPAMDFGKRFAKSVELNAPMAPVLIYSHREFPSEASLDGLPLVGYYDTWDPVELRLVDHKTGKLWTQKKVDDTSQFTFYCLLNYLTNTIRPEDTDIKLQSIPCGIRSDFTYGFELDKNGAAQIHTFDTKRTMTQVLQLASDLKRTRKEMEEYIEQRKK